MPLNIRSRRPTEGWMLFALIAAPCLVLSAATPILVPGIGGIRIVVSATARFSALLFCLAFAASSLYRLVPCGASRWLMRNRRHVGLAFAAVQTLHISALAIFAWASPPVFVTAVGGLAIGVSGAVGYVIVFAMAATSFRPTAALIGPRAWRAIHRAGGYVLWFLLVFAFMLHLAHNPTLVYANLEVGVLVVTLLVRLLPAVLKPARPRGASKSLGAEA